MNALIIRAAAMIGRKLTKDWRATDASPRAITHAHPVSIVAAPTRRLAVSRPLSSAHAPFRERGQDRGASDRAAAAGRAAPEEIEAAPAWRMPC